MKNKMIKRSSARLVVDNREMSAPPPDYDNDPSTSIRTVPSIIPLPPAYNNDPSTSVQIAPSIIPVPDVTEDSKPSLLSSTSVAAAAMASKVTSYFQPSTEPHELWSFTNALFFLILFVLVIWIVSYGLSTVVNIQHIKDDWANQRCSPMIMPFASFFDVDTKDNFEFCMGKIFNTHSQGYLGSIGGMFSGFTGLLQSIFDSISSMRNVIASLGGGINVIFQEFTERISTFFFQLRISAVRIKMLMGRLYAILFSVMYMGMSGISGMTSFTNTFLFSFLDTFCFPGETEVMVEEKGIVRRVPIKDVKIGEVIHVSRQLFDSIHGDRRWFVLDPFL
jgi:hypothetical protein